ncbi:MAG: response regulator transcription factor [Acidobacteria bacterium]|nr:response regulator transcription factor [Acidobacteriota bacterium]
MTTADETGSAPRRRALVVEDERHIRDLVTLHLGLEGLDVAVANAGDEAIRRTEAERFDLVILDLMLPNVDGVAVCRSIRRQLQNGDVPILMLTARRDESDKVLGLESGADDYLTKPFGIRELVARVRALLRRPRRSDGPASPQADVVEAGPLRLDARRRQAMLDGQPIELTPHEFDVLFLLAAHPGIVFTRETLLDRVWTPETHVTERSVDTLIKRLRQKIEADTRDPKLILTVWGTGYKFTDV